MKPNPTRSALLVIDMENGFVHPEGGHWIRFAQSMVPNCVRAVELARAKGIPVFFVKRLYRADGSDVELTRYPGWVAGGRACRPRLPGSQQRPGTGGPAAPARGLHHHQAPVERLFPDGAGPDPPAAGRADGDPHRHHHPQLHPHHLL